MQQAGSRDSNRNTFLLINSAGASGLNTGLAALREGQPLLHVLEMALREAEADARETSVGLGGLPNLLGEVELDASLMEGSSRRTGSVAALCGFLHPVSVAREIMRRLPHEILVGEGAAHFAREIGAERASLLTKESNEKWRSWLLRILPPEIAEVWPQALDPSATPLADLVWQSAKEHIQKDTAVVLAGNGIDLASGASTSGWPYKYPGRLGDSAIIGAGHYADSRYGAAACTHTGEMTIRAGTSRAIVSGLRAGLSPEEACREAIADLRELYNGLISHVIVYAVDAKGEHFAASTGIPADYYWWMSGMEGAEHREVGGI